MAGGLGIVGWPNGLLELQMTERINSDEQTSIPHSAGMNSPQGYQMTMKSLIAILFAFSVVALVEGQEKLSKEDTEKYARPCTEGFGKPLDAQLETQGDPTKAVAVRGEGGGAMVIPDKDLTADKLTKLGKDIVPVGQLWLRKWVPVADGKPVASDKNRVVTVKLDGKDRPMPVLLLGIRKTATEHELVVYAKDSDPLLVLSLKTVEFIQEAPIELEWERGEKNIDKLTMTILGKYRTIFPVSRE